MIRRNSEFYRRYKELSKEQKKKVLRISGRRRAKKVWDFLDTDLGMIIIVAIVIGTIEIAYYLIFILTKVK